MEVFEEAYASCVDGIRIFMQIQDENEYCPLSDISWLLERKGIEATKKSKPDERHIMQMKKYISEMEDVMKRTKETLFFEYANSGYQKGMATGILGRMMKVWRAQNKELEDELMGEKPNVKK
ncbi:MAG: hypothetical protein E7277_10340 [Lachnospiraceae bacterium]|nr:hypothetical protein [Lachnospiraceae bacterium]